MCHSLFECKRETTSEHAIVREWCASARAQKLSEVKEFGAV